jgi:hypothetical protein
MRVYTSRELSDYFETTPCPYCVLDERPAALQMHAYSHSGGVPVGSPSRRLWVYGSCESCETQWSLAKLLREW